MDTAATVELCAYICSALASSWLVGRCCRLKTLFGRQMFHLGLADLLNAVVPLLLLSIFSLPPLSDPDHTRAFCQLLLPGLDSFRLVSTFLELHIAVGLLGVLLHKLRVLGWLVDTFWVPWLLGGVLTIPDACFTYFKIHAEQPLLNRCEPRMPVMSNIMITTIALTMLVYLAGIGRSGWHVNDIVWQRARNRVFIYFVVFLSSILGVAVDNILPVSSVTLRDTAFTISNLNGLFNALAYGLLDRDHGQLCGVLRFGRQRHVHPSPRADFPVAFQSEVAVSVFEAVTVSLSRPSDEGSYLDYEGSPLGSRAPSKAASLTASLVASVAEGDDGRVEEGDDRREDGGEAGRWRWAGHNAGRHAGSRGGEGEIGLGGGTRGGAGGHAAGQGAGQSAGRGIQVQAGAS